MPGPQSPAVKKSAQPTGASPLILPAASGEAEMDERLQEILRDSNIRVGLPSGDSISLRLKDGKATGTFTGEHAFLSYQNNPDGPESFAVRLMSDRAFLSGGVSDTPGFAVEVGRGSLLSAGESLSNQFLHPGVLSAMGQPGDAVVRFSAQSELLSVKGRFNEDSQLIGLTFLGTDKHGGPIRFSTTFAHSDVVCGPEQSSSLLGLKLEGRPVALGLDVDPLHGNVRGAKLEVPQQAIGKSGTVSSSLYFDPMSKDLQVDGKYTQAFPVGKLSVGVTTHPMGEQAKFDVQVQFEAQRQPTRPGWRR